MSWYNSFRLFSLSHMAALYLTVVTGFQKVAYRLPVLVQCPIASLIGSGADLCRKDKQQLCVSRSHLLPRQSNEAVVKLTGNWYLETRLEKEELLASLTEVTTSWFMIYPHSFYINHALRCHRLQYSQLVTFGPALCLNN